MIARYTVRGVRDVGRPTRWAVVDRTTDTVIERWSTRETARHRARFLNGEVYL